MKGCMDIKKYYLRNGQNCGYEEKVSRVPDIKGIDFSKEPMKRLTVLTLAFNRKLLSDAIDNISNERTNKIDIFIKRLDKKKYAVVKKSKIIFSGCFEDVQKYYLKFKKKLRNGGIGIYSNKAPSYPFRSDERGQYYNRIPLCLQQIETFNCHIEVPEIMYNMTSELEMRNGELKPYWYDCKKVTSRENTNYSKRILI